MQPGNLFRALLPFVLSLTLLSAAVPASPAGAQDPSPSPSPPSPTPSPTPEPTPVASPEPTPSPTLEPTPTPARQIDKIALHQALLDLTNPWTVMCVAAHPDDEDGTTLTTLRRKHGVQTVSLFSTYGEGGQNATGPELYDELGVIRVRETMAAAEIQGSVPYFLGLRDFGFSKSSDETFRVWGQPEALRLMVMKIRELRPDVIITNHDTMRGHGHHQATGLLVLEAFEAAADPKRFPEQLQRVTVWQPKRLFVRFRSASGASAAKQDAIKTEKLVTVDPNERDPVRGSMFAEQALAALQQHATQGPWPKTIAERLASSGNPTGKLPLIRYALVREAAGVTPLASEATGFLDGLHLEDAVSAQLAPPTIEGRPLTDFIDMPDRILNALIDWRRSRSPSDIPREHSQRSRLLWKRVNRALSVASGITLTVGSRSSVLVRDNLTSFHVNLSNAGERRVQINRLSFDGWGTMVSLDAAELLVADSETTATVDQVTPTTAAITVPSADHLYDGRLFGERFFAEADLEIDGARFSLSAQTSLQVAPAIQIQNISPSPCVRTQGTTDQCRVFQVTITNHLSTAFRGQVKIAVHDPQVREERQEVALAPNETRQDTVVAVRPNSEPIGELNQSGALLFAINASETAEPITQRAVRVVYSNARIAKNLRVGYLTSFDRTLERSLASLGANATQLSLEDIQKAELVDYETIIIDNRGYQAHPGLIESNSRLLNYARGGGTLIVFYHKDNEWNPDEKRRRPQLPPYPIILGDERVTEENAPVKLLQPGHPLLSFPNRITETDFDSWIQERGLYYPKEWDRRYQAILATADEGDVPLRGGLLATRYGRGNYIYTSMVWYRQLAAGVPGAYRAFANMISYARKGTSRKSR